MNLKQNSKGMSHDDIVLYLNNRIILNDLLNPQKIFLQNQINKRLINDNKKDINFKYYPLLIINEQPICLERNFKDYKEKKMTGFIDLIVRIPFTVKSKGIFGNNEDNLFMEFPIEIKTENDLSDFGKILRQIKKYREFYQPPYSFNYFDKTFNKIYCVWSLITININQSIQDLFEEENINVYDIKNQTYRDNKINQTLDNEY